MTAKYSEGQTVSVSENVRTRDSEVLELVQGGAKGKIIEVIDTGDKFKTRYIIDFEQGEKHQIYESTIIGVEK